MSDSQRATQTELGGCGETSLADSAGLRLTCHVGVDVSRIMTLKIRLTRIPLKDFQRSIISRTPRPDSIVDLLRSAAVRCLYSMMGICNPINKMRRDGHDVLMT